MDLLDVLNSNLRTLSAETRRKHGAVKEASDRAVLRLRTISAHRTEAMQALQASGGTAAASDAAAAIELHNDVLVPFFMACALKPAKIQALAAGSLQTITAHGAVPPGSLTHLLEAADHLAESSDESVQIKTLQMILSLVTSTPIHGDALARALGLCFRLHLSKAAMVHNTAGAALRQLSLLLFDRLASEGEGDVASFDHGVAGEADAGVGTSTSPVDGGDGDQASATGSTRKRKRKDKARLRSPSSDESSFAALTASAKPCAQDAYFFLQDLCRLVCGDNARWIQTTVLGRSFGLELVESVVAERAHVFRAVRDGVCGRLLGGSKEGVAGWLDLVCRLFQKGRGLRRSN